MLYLNSLAMMAWQSAGVAAHDITSLRVAAWVIAIALVAQAAGVIAAAMFGAKLLHRMDGISKSLEEKTAPILARTNELLHEMSPKIHAITTNLEQASYAIRSTTDGMSATAAQLNETVAELNGRTRTQIRRADAIVTEALVATEEISQTVQQGIRIPVRQIAGIVAGVQAAVETFVKRSPFGRGE